MEILQVELILHLTPNVVEHILALVVRTIIEACLILYRLHLATAHLEFPDATASEDIDALAILGRLHHSASYALHDNLCLTIAHIVHPEVCIALEA